jgi:acyl-CoA dehydrogenase
MQFEYSPKVAGLQQRVRAFMDEHVYPNEQRFHAEVEENTRQGRRWTPTKLVEELKPKARAAGLWNLFHVINGRKWWTSGAGDPRCKVYIVMGKTDPDAPKHAQQSMILVPADTPGVKVLRPLNVFGYDDAPHGHMEVEFDDVRVPASNILLGEGRGFEIAQGRLGPGRIHHCMRSIGLAERALELTCKRLANRVAFGAPVARQTVWQERIAEARCMIDQARLLTLKAAYMMDTVGNKAAKAEIAMIKVVAPNVACSVLDWAIQAHGGGGMCDDFPLAYAYTLARTLRLADGPDEVHRNAIAKLEIARHVPMPDPGGTSR